MILELILLTSIFVSTPVAGAEPEVTQAKVTSNVQASAPAPLALADIIPAAEDLDVRLDALKIMATRLPDPIPIEREFALLEKRLALMSHQLDTTSGPRRAQYNRLLDLRVALGAEAESLAAESKPLKDSINALDKAGRAWRAEEEHWSARHSVLTKEKTAEPVRAALSKALSTINVAQGVVSHHLAALLVAQTKGAKVKAQIDRLTAELQSRLLEMRQSSLVQKSPPLYSAEYFDQFGPELWSATWNNLTFLSWPDSRILQQQDLGIGILLVSLIAICLVIFRNRRTLRESARWRFVADRPVSTALFICAIPLTITFQLRASYASFSLLTLVVGGIACARLLGSMLGLSWKRQAAYGVMISYLISMILFQLSIALPLVRLFLFVVTSLALFFCLRWARDIIRRNEPSTYAWMLRSIAVLCAVILIADFLGEAGVAVYLFGAALETMTISLLLVLFVYVLHGGLHWLFFASPVRSIELIRDDADGYVRRVGFLLELMLIMLVFIPAVLMAWGGFDNYPDAVLGVLKPGFSVGSQFVSIGLILLALGTLYGSFLAASIIPRVLFDEKFAGKSMDRGVRLSVGQLMQYFIGLIGVLLTLGFIGFDLTKLTIILSAFGVGIGFGLQSIVNNFVSGLILLFERPLREGDTIEVRNERVHIRKIGLRATHVKTFDMADVIIPNADIVNNPVTNWTLDDPLMRLSVPVGVSYGSDIHLVRKSLLASAEGNAAVLKSPPPEVILLNLGDSSLDFELRVWIADVDRRLSVKSELYGDILNRFNEVGIEIPFPQRDLHVRSADESIIPRATQRGDSPSKSA